MDAHERRNQEVLPSCRKQPLCYRAIAKVSQGPATCNHLRGSRNAFELFIPSCSIEGDRQTRRTVLRRGADLTV